MKSQKKSAAVTGLFSLLFFAIAATEMLPVAARAATSTWASNSSGNFSVPGSWSPSGAPGTGADLLIGDINSGTGITRTASGDLATAFNSLAITQATTPGSGTTNNQVKLTTQDLTLSGATPFTLTGASAAGVATFDFGGKKMTLSNAGAKTLTFGNFTALANTGGTATTAVGGFNPTTSSSLTLNFNGGQLSGNPINTGAGDTVNVTQAMGSGTMVLGTINNAALSTLNLNGSGVMALGSTFVNYSDSADRYNNSTSVSGLAVTVASSMTGLSSGIVTTQLLANASNPLSALSATAPQQGTNLDSSLEYLYNRGATSLTFASGGTGFTFSGGVIDIRSKTAGQGIITTNGEDITITGGGLAGSKLTASAGIVTISGGQLALQDTSGGVAGAVSYIVADSGNLSTNTIVMPSGGNGTLSLANNQSASTISIPLLSDGGTWNRGTINADRNYTIVNSGTSGFGTSGTFASFTVADNSGLNGLAMGTAGVPTTLTLGVNSSFYVASSTATGARIYNVGPTGGSNNVITPAAGAGGFTFGINNSTATQTINLNRDKGGDSIALLSPGTNGAVNITSNQTGAGNLMVNATTITLNSGVNFSGTGGVYTDPVVGNLMGDSVLNNAAGSVSGTGYTDMTFNVNGSLSGINTIALNPDVNNRGEILLGSTASVGGVQTWLISNTFANNMTTPANWAGNVTMQVNADGTIEASTNTSAPTTGSNYKFNRVTWTLQGTHTVGLMSLSNLTQNDGSPGQNEALYASSLAFSFLGVGDYHFNMAGQDVYVDRFANFTAPGTNLVLRNDTLNSVSQFKAIGTVGDALVNGGLMVLNGATLAVVGGNYYGEVPANTVGYAADTAAAPNSFQAYQNKQRATLGFNGANGYVDAFTSFLGSGNDKGTDPQAVATFLNTNGTFRVLGGNIVSSGYLLNPVGVSGTIDTTGTSGANTDTTLNNVTIRGGATQTVSAALSGGVATFTPTAKQIYANGDPITLSGSIGLAGMPGGTYYIVNATGTTFQLAATQGAGAVTGVTGTFSSATVTDIYGASTSTAYPGLIVGGNTTVNGNLVIGYAPGATNQATLRVGGDNATGYSSSTGPTAHAGSGQLNVTGDLTTQSFNGTSVNVSIQSNGTVKVGGNVSIAGVGTNVAFATNDVTGMDGVGINAASNFTLNGNKGAGTPQTVNIVPSVGNFHVGDGSGGTLTGTAAQGKLTCNLTSATSADINGATSVLDLNGFNFTANGSGLAIGGTAIVSGVLTGNTTVNIGGTLQLGNGGTAGTIALSSTITNNGNFTINRSNAVVQGTDFSSAPITGNGSLTQAGTGTLTLAGTNTYTGATQVWAGTLLISGSASIAPSSPLDVSSGATVQNASGAAIASSLTLNEGSSLVTSSSGSGFSGAVSFAGDLSDGWTAITLTNTSGSGLLKGGAFTLTLTGIAAGTYNLTSGAGFSGTFASMNINGNALSSSDGGANWTGINIGGVDYAYANSSNILIVTPEPTTWALLVLSLTTVLVLRRQRIL